jgi:hypothetical protein
VGFLSVGAKKGVAERARALSVSFSVFERRGMSPPQGPKKGTTKALYTLLGKREIESHS